MAYWESSDHGVGMGGVGGHSCPSCHFCFWDFASAVTLGTKCPKKGLICDRTTLCCLGTELEH